MNTALGMDATFKTSEIVKIASFLRINLSSAELRDWQRPERNILETEPVGKGREREFAFDQMVLILSLALMMERFSSFKDAEAIAKAHAKAVVDVYATGPDGKVVDAVPPQIVWMYHGWPKVEVVDPELSVRALSSIHACEGVMLINPGAFALKLYARVLDCLAWREGLPDGMSLLRQQPK